MPQAPNPTLPASVLMAFKLATGVALVGWLVLVVATPWMAPSAGVGHLLLTTAIALLCGLYAYLLVHALQVRRAPGSDRPGFVTARGVLALLASPRAALAAWVHILAFDLAVAVHLHGEAMRLGISHLAMVPVYLLTLMFGPLGYLAFLGLAWLW
jgi:Domain of unknown function (DUF4281)